MASLIRGLVSKKKRRYTKEGFNLDLSYIIPTVIAMGFPSQGGEGMYRNPMKEVQRFLSHYHEGHYKVYNLCSEKTYNPKFFNNSTASYPFDDHNPCPFRMLLRFCVDVHTFLSDNPKNTVAIHCKAGKGRTGLMICCYLLYNKMFSTAQESLDFYGEARTRNKKGVTIASQIRWVHYFEQFLKKYLWATPPREFPFTGVRMRMTKITFGPKAPKFDSSGCTPYIRVSRPDRTITFNQLKALKDLKGSDEKSNLSEITAWKRTKTESVFTINCDVEICGNVHVVVSSKKGFGKDQKMLSFWEHTGFLYRPHEERKSVTDEEEKKDSAKHTITKRYARMELDKANKDKKHYDDTFYIEVTYEEVPWEFEGREEEVVNPASLESKDGEEGDKAAGLTKYRSKTIRGLVSKKKKRFIKDGFDLDLSYVCNDIIAMGFPSEGLEGRYRNNMKDVQKFFAHYHPQHFKVYNLCSERSYHSRQFNNSTASFPFDDHNPCPFLMLVKFCQDVDMFLGEHQANVVAIHCKAGKGRTGLMICAYLQWSGRYEWAQHALDYYADRRTENRKGVTIPSQIRYVRYMESYVRNFKNAKLTPWHAKFQGKYDEELLGGETEQKEATELQEKCKAWSQFQVPQRSPLRSLEYSSEGVKLRMVGILMKGGCPNFDKGGGCDPYFKVYKPNGEQLYNYKNTHKKVVSWRPKGPNEWLLCCEVPVQGDFKVQFFDFDFLSSDDKMFKFWMNTNFILNDNKVVMTKPELDDAVKDKSCKLFNADFSVTVYFADVPGQADPFFSLSAEQEDLEVQKRGYAQTVYLEGGGGDKAHLISGEDLAKNATFRRKARRRQGLVCTTGLGTGFGGGAPEKPPLPEAKEEKGTPETMVVEEVELNEEGEKVRYRSATIRGLVSKKKKRFIQDGFDLDLSYITDKIIAMGFPSEGLQGTFRNNMKDVKKFFAQYHDGNYKVYNLCSERTYKPSHFNNSCAHYPFDDHNPCALQRLEDICVDVHRFLSKDEDNVVAIHCKAGKGRTGLIICCYLVYAGICDTAKDALAFYAKRRTTDGKGVTIPSQIRYVHYFERVVKDFLRIERPFKYGGPTVVLKRIVCSPRSPNPKGCGIYFKILRNGRTEVFDYRKNVKKVQSWKSAPTHTLDSFFGFKGDVKFQFYEKATFGKGEKLFAFWLHSGLITSDTLVLKKHELDGAVKDKKCASFLDTFKVTITFDMVGQSEQSWAESKRTWMQEKGLLPSESKNSVGTDEDDPPPPPPPEDEFSGDESDPPPPPPPDSEEEPEPEDNSQTVEPEPEEPAPVEESEESEPEQKVVVRAVRDKDLHVFVPPALRVGEASPENTPATLILHTDEYDLNLSYITDNIIASAFPSTSVGFFGVPREALLSHLEEVHEDMYKVYNLCAEKSYPLSVFGEAGQCANVPIDVNFPPSFRRLLEFVTGVEEFLESTENEGVVVVHDMTGTFRCALMISAYLLYAGKCRTFRQALNLFAKNRVNAGKSGAGSRSLNLLPSQYRYLAYFNTYLRDAKRTKKPIKAFLFRAPSVTLTAAVLETDMPRFDISGQHRLYVRVYRADGETVMYDSRDAEDAKRIKEGAGSGGGGGEKVSDVELEMSVSVSGDVKLSFYTVDDVRQMKKDGMLPYELSEEQRARLPAGLVSQVESGVTERFSVWINTYFVRDAELRFTKNELDGAVFGSESSLDDPDVLVEPMSFDFSMSLFFDDVKSVPTGRPKVTFAVTSGSNVAPKPSVNVDQSVGADIASLVNKFAQAQGVTAPAPSQPSSIVPRTGRERDDDIYQNPYKKGGIAYDPDEDDEDDDTELEDYTESDIDEESSDDDMPPPPPPKKPGAGEEKVPVQVAEPESEGDDSESSDSDDPPPPPPPKKTVETQQTVSTAETAPALPPEEPAAQEEAAVPQPSFQAPSFQQPNAQLGTVVVPDFGEDEAPPPPAPDMPAGWGSGGGGEEPTGSFADLPPPPPPGSGDDAFGGIDLGGLGGSGGGQAGVLDDLNALNDMMDEFDAPPPPPPE